jgi:hypothetical protein
MPTFAGASRGLRLPRLFILLVALQAPQAHADSRSSFDLRIGGSASYLTGSLGAYYPNPSPTAVIGLGYRRQGSMWAFRTGLQLVSRAGTSRDTTFEVGGVFGAPGFTVTNHETWHSLRLQMPIVGEARWHATRVTHPYVAAGLGFDTRIPEALGDDFRGANPTYARRFGSSVLVALGIESMRKPGHRLGLGYEAGLTSLYDKDQGRQGSWQNIQLVFDVDLK